VPAPIRVGVCSWADETLTKVWYPKGIKSGEERLRYYADRFDVVEANSTYYRLPDPHLVENWTARTPEDFTMHVKAFGVMTRHPVKVDQLPTDLRDVPTDARGRVDRPSREYRAEVFRRFHDALEPLRSTGKLGGILMQFPPYVVYKPASLEYLEWSQEQLGGDEMMVEFRHASWHREETWELLRRRRAAVAWTEWRELPRVTEVTADFLYLRWLGERREIERYDRVQIDRTDSFRAWEADLMGALGRVREIYGYFNNHWAGHSPASANEMKRRLGLVAIEPRDHWPQGELFGG